MAMTEDTFRTIGAVTGLILGIGLMMGLGYTGMVPGAIFGAGGTVAGGMSGEKFYQWRGRGQR